MLSESIVAGIAQSSLLWFAVMVGIIVSFDVIVLEFTRQYDNENSSFPDPQRAQMRVLHPLFHGGSFFIYSAAIALMQTLTIRIPEIFHLGIPKNVIPAFMYLISVIVFIFVWITYINKISEDHSQKIDSIEQINRFDMRQLFSVFEIIANRVGAGHKTKGAAIAATVAIDMLAISALIKDYLLPTIKDGSISDPISRLSGLLIIDLLTFSLIIAMIVFLFVLVAQEFGKLTRHDARLVMAFRVLEPLAVFFIALESIRSIIGYMNDNIAEGVHEFSWTVDLLFSTMMVFSLMIGSGRSPRELIEIWSKDKFKILTNESIAKTDSEFRSKAENNYSNQISNQKTALHIFTSTSLSLLIIFVSMWISYTTVNPLNPHNHLVESTAYFSTAFSLIVTIIMYIPSKKLDEFETNQKFNFYSQYNRTSFYLFSPVIGAGLGSCTLVIFGYVYMGRNFETDVIALWLGYLISVWFLFQLRCARFLLAGEKDGAPRRATDADFSELLSAFGVASSMVALVATVWASGLWIKIIHFLEG